MNTKKLISVLLIAFLVLTFGSSALTQDLSGIPGAFVDVGLGLRPMGMGGAYSALATDEHAARWNPAALSATKDPSSGFAWTNQFAEDTYNYISLTYPGLTEVGLGVYGIANGDDVYSELTVGIGAGIGARKMFIPVDNLHFGLAFKYLSTSFGNDEDGGEERTIGSSAGYGLDIGILYQPTNQISLAVVMRDALSGITWDSSYLDSDEKKSNSYSEDIPRDLVLSLGWMREKATFALEYHPGIYPDVQNRAALGVEVTVLKIFKPRFGFAQNLASGYTNQWMTFGLGIEIKSEKLGPIRNVNFGYTHVMHEIADTPRVGLSIGW